MTAKTKKQTQSVDVFAMYAETADGKLSTRSSRTGLWVKAKNQKKGQDALFMAVVSIEYLLRHDGGLFVCTVQGTDLLNKSTKLKVLKDIISSLEVTWKH
ncbi:hypothetical protein IRJ41_014703 [Triplophysa rosa]|uniref:Uncharacterized protein n=1 Tax=Triplophysa rosa TaxID=992332 RepID=A0A9W7WDQ0_TRIRA|nr:hypothetical protein IRJ41_014703 [Triplophysa rosa]